MKNLITRALTGVVFVAVLVGCIVSHPYAFALLFALISALTTWEFGTIVNNNADLQVNRFITSVSSAYLFIALLSYNVNLMDATVFIPYIISIMYLMISELYFDRKNNIQNWAFALMSQMYIALPFALLNTMSFINMPESCFMSQLVYYYWYPLALFIFLWSNDTGAYCFGSLLGKHHRRSYRSHRSITDYRYIHPLLRRTAGGELTTGVVRIRTRGCGVRYVGRPRGVVTETQTGHQGLG